MTDEFLNAVADQLKLAGFESKYDGVFLVVAGCKFEAVERRKGNGVKFLGSSFKVDADGSFDMSKAIGLVVAALPEKLKQKKALENIQAFRVQLREHVKGGSPVTEYGYKDWYPAGVEGAFLSASEAGIELKTVHPSVEEALACLKKLVP